MAGVPGEDKRNLLPLKNGEVGHGREVLAAQRNIRVKRDRIRARDGADALLDPAYPGDHGTVVEAENELHAHRDLAAPADD